MTNYHYRMYNVANVLDEKEVRERLIRSKRGTKQIQLPSIGEQLDAMAAKLQAWFAGPPKPSQECC